ncbi:MAG: DUF6088 family protein [Planctomycetota bacterium]|nr:DUF6088 family protein [Planctomycetota bacterium]
MARRNGTTIQPSEAEAANLLHLSDQVPARIAFDADGPSKTVVVGKLSLRFHGRSRRKVGSIAPLSSLVFAGLRNIGPSHVTVERVKPLSKTLTPVHRRQLLKDLPKAPRWMHPFLRFLSRADGDDALPCKGRKAKKRA